MINLLASPSTGKNLNFDLVSLQVKVLKVRRSQSSLKNYRLPPSFRENICLPQSI